MSKNEKSQKVFDLPLPHEDRHFLDYPKSAVSAAVLFSAVQDAHAAAPHPLGLEWGRPLLDDRPGAGALDLAMGERFDQNWENTWNQVTSVAGLSVPYASDLPDILLQRRALVEGVIQGRVDIVERALSKGAAPNTLVPVIHPNAVEGEQSYVVMPIGVAAVMFGQRYAQTAKAAQVESPAIRNQVAAYERIAARLLLDAEDRPTVRVGTAPDGTGMALSFYGWGVSRHHNPADRQLPTEESREFGHLTLVRHNETINLSLANALSKISPALFAERRLLPQLSGDELVGDILPPADAMSALVRGRKLEEAAQVADSPIPRTRVSPAEKVILDSQAPVPRPLRP